MIEQNNLGEFRDESGRLYIECRADSLDPFFIDVSAFKIEALWRGQRYSIDLGKYKLPAIIIDAAKDYLKFKLKSVSPHLLPSVSYGLSCLEKQWNKSWGDFSCLSLGDLFSIIVGSSRNGRELRSFYRYSAQNGLAGADEIHALELEAIKLGRNMSKKIILEWHETRGALTSSEVEVVRRAMVTKPLGESILDATSRLFTWIAFETLKRPIQLIEMLNDALWIPDPTAVDQQFFLRIPKAKKQRGQVSELWPITEQLALAIQSYSHTPRVRDLQDKHKTLLVHVRERKRPDFGRRVTTWSRRLGLVSPRTKKLLVLTPYRIRHSGATQMAAQGASRDEIQYVLEHDSVTSADWYIDCLASEFCPLLERANKQLGGVFSELNGIFFNGRVGARSSGSPIMIPLVQQPALVGECGSGGVCGQHPFFSCYNGCRYFIAWRDADHQKSLEYLEVELARWDRADGGKERSKILKDLERIYQAVKDVIARIKNGE